MSHLSGGTLKTTKAGYFSKPNNPIMIQMKKSFLSKQGALTQAFLDVSCCSECGMGGGRVGESKRGGGAGGGGGGYLQKIHEIASRLQVQACD